MWHKIALMTAAAARWIYYFKNNRIGEPRSKR